MEPEVMQANRSGLLYPFPGAVDGHTREELAECFRVQFGHVPIGGSDTFARVPVVLKPAELQRLERMTQALREALEQVVTHYFQDERIRAIYGLDPFFESVLEWAQNTPYHIGACRPDFLQTPEGQPKICEIGARFPLNGWMVSYYLNRFSPQLTGYPKADIGPVAAVENIPEAFLKYFQAELPVTLLLDHEKGSEIHWLLDRFREQGRQVHMAKPQSVAIKDGALWVEDQPMQQFILEMDREELRKFQPEVLQKLIQETRHFNDVRTLILVHDKRVLAVLYDETIMRDYLSAETYDLLRPFLVPSFSLHDPHIRQKITDEPGQWVLKQSSGGRGVGMYVRAECDEALWHQTVAEEWPGYMVQTYVPQQTYDWEGNDIHIVGMLLCFNDAFLGAGIYRGSHHSVVNVHQGRGIIFPSALFKNR